MVPFLQNGKRPRIWMSEDQSREQKNYHAKLASTQMNSCTCYTHSFFIVRNLHIKSQSLPNVSVKSSKTILSIISNLQEHFKPLDFCPAKEIFHKDLFSDSGNLHFYSAITFPVCHPPQMFVNLKTRVIPAHFFCFLG